MGRPLNKKYFGNRNIGGTGTTDDYGIGGEGVASINWASLGTFRTTPVGLALPAPTLPTGVQATWDAITYKVNGVVTSAGKTNLAVGWKGTSALFPNMVAVVTSTSGSNAVFSILTADGGAAGDTLSSVPNAGNTNTITLTHQGATGGAGLAGTFVVDVNLQIVALNIVEKGSGYVGTETFTVTVAGGMDPPAGTLVLTTDTGSVGSSTYQENAIRLTAYIPTISQAGWVSGYSGSSAVTGDIVRQTGNGKFIARTAQGVGRVKLVGYLGSNVTPAAGEAVITASDYDGGLYYVTKISDRRCNIIGYTGSGFNTGATGINVPWTFNDYNGDKVDANQPYLESGVNVKINNA